MALKPFNLTRSAEVHDFQSIVSSSWTAFACKPWVLNFVPCGRSSHTLFTRLTMSLGVSKVAVDMILESCPKKASKSSWPKMVYMTWGIKAF